MKPSWKDAPEWAQYLAMDKDGAWYWYAKEPALSGYWYWVVSCGMYELIEKDTSGDWLESLEKRPDGNVNIERSDGDYSAFVSWYESLTISQAQKMPKLTEQYLHYKK